MRGIVFLFLVSALLIAGCVDLSKVDVTPVNPTNTTGTQYPAVCSGSVCGTDGNTYPSDCAALDAGVQSAYLGMCIPECTDTDGGEDAEAYGTASVGELASSDFCIDASILVEYSCDGGAIANSTLTCAQGKKCERGRCVIDESAPNETEPEDNETVAIPSVGCHGPTEPDEYVMETITYNGVEFSDVCVDYQLVKDYYCKDGEPFTINNECEPGYGCMLGKCEFVPYTCIETDGGNDTLNRGRTTVAKGIYTGFNEMDECVDDGRVLEHMCLGNGSAFTQELLCGSGLKCFVGRCLRSDCSEDDGGYNLFERGVSEAHEEEYHDECLDDVRIREYYCYGDDVDSALVKCPEGYVCDSGRCEEE
ncbi:MAG: hypothetical protein ABII71_05820 [Candidatus Micrarchaeota archaeon]